jgi:orotate phosphoribosyltransferase
MVAIFTYGFELAEANMKDAACPYYTLSNYKTLIQQALNSNSITQSDLEALENWRKDPANWLPK